MVAVELIAVKQAGPIVALRSIQFVPYNAWQSHPAASAGDSSQGSNKHPSVV